MANDQKAPAGIAGITNYDVAPERFKLKPSHVIALVSFVVVIEAVLFYSVPI